MGLLWSIRFVVGALVCWLFYRLGCDRAMLTRHLELNMPPERVPTFEPADEWESWVLSGNTGDDRTSAWTYWEWQDDVDEAAARSAAVLAESSPPSPPSLEAYYRGLLGRMYPGITSASMERQVLEAMNTPGSMLMVQRQGDINRGLGGLLDNIGFAPGPFGV